MQKRCVRKKPREEKFTYSRKKEGIAGRMEMRIEQAKVIGPEAVLKRGRKGIKALDATGTDNND